MGSALRTNGYRVPPDASEIVKMDLCAYAWDAQPNGLTPGKSYLLAFIGKAKKPAAYYAFRNQELRDKYLGELLDRREKDLAYKAERAAAVAAEKAKAVELVKVGDIFVCSWGWEQTNVDFYEVTAKSGAKVTLKAIAQNIRETGFLSGYCTPKPGMYLSDKKPLVKMIRGCGGSYGAAITMNSYSSAYLCEKKKNGSFEERYWSSYA